MTPYEALYSNKPNLSHLKIINSTLYSHNVEHESGPMRQRKLEPRARKLRLINYEKGTNQYKAWNPETNRIENVTFVRADESDTQVSQRELDQSKIDEPKINDSDYDESNSNNSISEYRASGSAIPNFHIAVPPLPSDHSTYRPIKANEATILDLSNVTNPEPTTYRDAINGPESKQWTQAMKKEFNSLIENDTWNLISLLNGRKALGGK
jgi:hypothetical protein